MLDGELTPRGDLVLGLLLEQLPPETRDRLRPQVQPWWISPMLPTLADQVPDAGDWIYEPKLDGIRCLAFVAAGRVRLVSRDRKQLNPTYPELTEALAQAGPSSAIFDGEIVALSGGLPSRAHLEQRRRFREPPPALRAITPVYYYLFDLPYLEGYDLAELPLAQRKVLLREALPYTDPLRLINQHHEGAPAFFHGAGARGWEGILAKRLDSRYSPHRSPDWLQLKALHQQEFVIGGYTEPLRGSELFGALLVGYYAEGRLRYAGKVGTGYDEDAAQTLLASLRPLRQRSSPFAGAAPGDPGVHWVVPLLVARVGFAEWTPSGLLRHPRYLGMRYGRSPRQVKRELGRSAEHS